jgi:6-phosphofructokinase 1
MKRIAILTAGGDTPALNATIAGAVTRANALQIRVFGIIKGFSGMLNPRFPHLELNPLFHSIPELNPCYGGTILGASRTYIDSRDKPALDAVAHRLKTLQIDGLICIGGDGTINGMQPLAEYLPVVLAPKTIDNDLGLNYPEEANDWIREPGATPGKYKYRKLDSRPDIELDEIINYATPGYATAVYVAASGIERIRTTAESHRRIAIIEVMGRDSGYIALGSAYGQPDMILVPESPIDFDRIEQRVRELYELQKNVVVVVGEGVVTADGRLLGDDAKQFDPSGKPVLSGAAEVIRNELCQRLGDSYFTSKRRNEGASSAIFTRKLGHTQRGGRPIHFDRFQAMQLGGKAVDLLHQGASNYVATLQWTETRGFFVDAVPANKLRDQWGGIHPRLMHKSLYDAARFKPSDFGEKYLAPIFTNAIGPEDLEAVRVNLFHPGNLRHSYQSVNVDIQKRIRLLDG